MIRSFKAMYSGALNSKVIDISVSGKEFLSKMPRGAYTVCRTVHQKNIFNWNMHLQRLAKSSIELRQLHGDVSLPVDSVSSMDILSKPQLFQRLVEKCAKCALTNFHEKFHANLLPTDEFRITILIPLESSTELPLPVDPAVYCHVEVLPNRLHDAPVVVEILGSRRENPSVKDSNWLREKKMLQNLKRVDSEDVILSDNDELLEGSETNFFAVRGGVVITADKGILKGTVRSTVLKVCEDNNIPVSLRAPTIADLSEATGAFITSTSRLLLPIDRIVISCDCTRTFKQGDPTINVIMEKVLEDAMKHSTYIY